MAAIEATLVRTALTGSRMEPNASSRTPNVTSAMIASIHGSRSLRDVISSSVVAESPPVSSRVPSAGVSARISRTASRACGPAKPPV